MRLWLKDSERRPDPTPRQTDDRIPLAIGTVAWLVALGCVLLVPELPDALGGSHAAWTCLIGVALGAIGFSYVVYKRRH